MPTVTDQIDAEVLDAGGSRPQADRLVRHRGRPCRPRRGATARHHRDQHAWRPDRGHSGHDDGAHPRGVAPPRRGRKADPQLAAGPAGVPTSMLGHRIWGKRLGIVGMGRIGSALARRAKGFGLSVHYHNRRPVPEEVENELEATTGRASTRCSPIWTSSRSIARTRRPPTTCSRRAGCGCCRKQAILVNTARGEIVDEEELTPPARDPRDRRRRSRRVRARAGDRPASCAALDNVVLLPHMGSATIEGRARHGREGHHQHQDLRRRPPPA